jgi:hypothetical protein
VQDLTDPSRVGQQIAHRRSPEARLRWDQPIGTQVVIGGGIQVDQPLLPQLHHGDRRERLGDGADPKDGVLSNGRVRRDVREAVPGEELEASVADHAHRQTDRWPAVQDPADSGLQPERIDAEGPVIRGRDLRFAQ